MIRRGLGSDYNEGTGVDQDNTDGDNIKCNCKENIVEMEKVVINSKTFKLYLYLLHKK